jgi:hypothetical protein
MPVDQKTIHADVAITNLLDSPQSLTIVMTQDASGCVYLSQDTFSVILQPKQTRLMGWFYGFTKKCTAGQYLILVETSSQSQILSRDYLKITIADK